MVVSQIRGTRIKTPICYNPCYRDPQTGTPDLGKPPYWGMETDPGFKVAFSLDSFPSAHVVLGCRPTQNSFQGA